MDNSEVLASSSATSAALSGSCSVLTKESLLIEAYVHNVGVNEKD